MCDFNPNFKSAKKSATGYKVVVEDKWGHYYSPFTGVRYRTGKIPKPKKLWMFMHDPQPGKYCINAIDYELYWINCSI